MRPDDAVGGYIYPAGNGTRNTGFEEISVTHPYSLNTTAAGANASSRFEYESYPRAIIER